MSPRDRQEVERIIVGVVREPDDEVVLIPERAAMDLARLWGALRTAKTWGEFRGQVADAQYRDAAERVSGYEDSEPAAEEPFDRDQIYGLLDGDWPEWPQKSMLYWVPPAVQAFGRAGPTALNGEFLSLPAAKLTQILEAMDSLGYRCRRDDALVLRCLGN